MNESSNIIKNILIYALCVPVAVFVGYQLTNPLTYSAFGWIGALLFICAFPIMFRWHHFLMVLSFNTIAVVFFIPGRPGLGLVMAALSLGLSILQRTLNRHMPFIWVPQLTRPLIFTAVVVLVTAELTGGIGLRSMGSSVYGGRKYVMLLCGIFIYFALTARRIPRDKVWTYVGAFFFGGMTTIIPDLFALFTPSLHFLFWIFPPSEAAFRGDTLNVGVVRLSGAGGVAIAIFSYLLARYGVRSMLAPNGAKEVTRLCLLIVGMAFGMLGGFRSLIVVNFLIFSIMFYLEGLHRTKYLVRLVVAGLVLATGLVVFSSKLPSTIQRSLTVLPLPLKLDNTVVMDAQASKDWRIRIWQGVLPEIPRYLLLGKGYGISTFDFNQYSGTTGISGEQSFSAISSDFHNGPISVLIPFGIWGGIAWLWFLIATGRALYANYRYGPPEFKTLNSFLMASFFARCVMFFFVFGAYNDDLFRFAGMVGLSVSLNGGVYGSKKAIPSEAAPKGAFINILRRPKPAYQP